MTIVDIFKSKAERERDATRKRRKAFREAENAVDVVRDRVAKLKKGRDQAWSEARQYLKDGQKTAAQRLLQTCRASEVLMSKLEMKRWVFEQLLSKLELARSDQDFTLALSAINTVVKIDPETVASVLDEVQDKLGDQVDTDKIWEKMHEKEMEGAQTQMADVIPTIEDMAKQLEDEAAADVGGTRPVRVKEDGEVESSLTQRIGAGRKRLKDLLEEER